MLVMAFHSFAFHLSFTIILRNGVYPRTKVIEAVLWKMKRK